MTITVTDLFCGAGGSSLGAEAAGLTLRLAMNHWQTAIDVHQQHFPEAGHDCADISQTDPRRYERTDILLASPECTNHSQARGVSRRKQQPSLWDAPDPAAERSRATMWDVPRFAEQMRYDAVVVENVIEATKWVNWRSWCMAMDELGYQRTVLSHNSMHHGVPQSRDRIYVVFTRKGLNPELELELRADCPRCGASKPCRQAWKNGRTVGRYRQQWVWVCTSCRSEVEPATNGAEQIIDWSLDCPRIGDRARPLAARTRERIIAGLERHGWLPVITAGAGNTYETTPGNRAKPLSEPLPVQTTSSTHALATPPAFMVQTAHGGRLHDLDRPHPTVCASDDRLSLVVNLRGSSRGHVTSSTSPTSDPLSTVTANGNHHGLVVTVANAAAVRTTGEPLTAVTCKDRHALLVRNQSVRPGENPGFLTTSVADPAGTLTTSVNQSLLSPAAVVDDCGFRMLQPHEVAAAMAFPDGYIPRDLTKRDQVKLAGNAVTPPVMGWITGRIAQAMEAA